jgi:signal recognition particle subunit SRP68
MLILRRCLTIGHSRAVMEEPKNALALYARALSLSIKVLSIKALASSEAKGCLPKLDIEPDDLRDFSHYMEGLMSKYQALVELKNLIEQRRTGAKDVCMPPLAERLDQYPIEDVDLANLVNFPPKLQPVPVKPLFFDLAWNYIDYPGRAPSGVSDEPVTLKEAEEVKKESTKKGWFGFGR